MPLTHVPSYYNLTEDTLSRLDLLESFSPGPGPVYKDAVSAARRAATSECRKSILEVARRAVDGNLHPPFLTSYCPTPGLWITRMCATLLDFVSV
jgi:hypothetical protein